jgi:hypothetical protein
MEASMDSDDRFYDALQSDQTVSARQRPQESTAWWLAYTIALTILAAIVAIVLVVMCAASFILIGLAGWGKRWFRLKWGRGHEPGAGSGDEERPDMDGQATHRSHSGVGESR